MKTRVGLKCFSTDCPWKNFSDSYSSQTPSNLISLIIWVTLRLLTLILHKVRASKLQKKEKIRVN